MSALPTVLFAAGSVMSAIGQVKQGREASAASDFNATVSQAKAKTIQESAAFQSETLKKRSELERFKLSQDKKSVLSTQRAGFAKAGVRLFEGSPLEVQADAATQFEMDLSASRYNEAVALEEIRFESETGVARTTSQAEAFRLKSKAQRTSGYMGAGSSILSSAGTYGLLKGK